MSWVEVDGGGWRRVKVGARFGDTQYKIFFISNIRFSLIRNKFLSHFCHIFITIFIQSIVIGKVAYFRFFNKEKYIVYEYIK